jgi:transposase-like protein
MTRQRRSFDPSCKLEVVRMIKEQGLSISHVSQTMDIGMTAIRRAGWSSTRLSNKASQELASR